MAPDIVVAFCRGWRWPLRREDTLEIWNGTDLLTTLPAAIVYQVLGLVGTLRALDAALVPSPGARELVAPLVVEAVDGPRLRGLGGRMLRMTPGTSGSPPRGARVGSARAERTHHGR